MRHRLRGRLRKAAARTDQRARPRHRHRQQDADRHRALWVATAGGLLACVNPATGTVRAQEVTKSLQAKPIVTLAAEPRTHQLAAVISTIGVATITPPRSCWT